MNFKIGDSVVLPESNRFNDVYIIDDIKVKGDLTVIQCLDGRNKISAVSSQFKLATSEEIKRGFKGE